MATFAEVEAAVENLLAQQYPEALRAVLHPRCRWGDCVNADAVIRTMESMLSGGVDVLSWTTSTHDDRVAVSVVGTVDGQQMTAHLAMVVNDGLVTDILDAPDAAGVRSIQPPEPPQPPDPLAPAPQMHSLAAVLPCRNLGVALAHYELLGFSTHSYDDGYGYADREGVSLHLARVPELDPLTTTSAVYLFVSDAAALHAAWIESGANGRFTTPEATPYGLLEGAHIDPDGNLLRYGSRIG